MAFKIYNYENTLKFHRGALLNAVEKVNDKHKNFQDLLIVISTKNMIKTLPISLITGRKTVVYITGFGRLYTDYGVVGRLLFKTIVKIYSKISAVAFIVEHPTDQLILEKCSDVDVFTVNGSGLDVEQFKIKIKNKKTKLKFGYLSRFGESKGSDQILKLARNLPFDYELYIAGWDIKNSRYADYFRKISNEKDNIFFIGKLNNRVLVSDFFNDIDCFLAPSKREGGCISIQEAIWHKVPFVTTNVPGCDRLAKIFKCPAFNLKNFADNILLSDLNFEKIDKSSWDKKLKPFMSDSVSNEFYAIFDYIAKRNSI